jgi:hypothetical protein
MMINGLTATQSFSKTFLSYLEYEGETMCSTRFLVRQIWLLTILRNILRYYLNREMRPEGSVTLTTWYLLSAQVGNHFTDKRRSVGIVRSRTRTMEFFIFLFFIIEYYDKVFITYYSYNIDQNQKKTLKTSSLSCTHLQFADWPKLNSVITKYTLINSLRRLEMFYLPRIV